MNNHRHELKGSGRVTPVNANAKGHNPNHHLWNNNGTWFAHFTIHPTRITKQRIRCSLNTRNLLEARERRDKLFRQLRNAGESTSADVQCFAV